MTAQSVSTAVAGRQKQDHLVDWVRSQQDEIAMVAATHIKPSAIVRVAHGALRRNPKLMAAAIANPQSLMYALLDAARLGHEPDTDDYYLVPFGSEVQGIEGYKGIIERMYRARGVSSVVAQVVRQRDRYATRGENTPPLHEYDDFASPEDRGPMHGAYAYAIFPEGHCSQVIRMGRAEIMLHKAKSRGSDKPDSPWQQWEPQMWKKTVLRGLEPYVPTSTEYRTAVAGHAAAAVAALPQPAVASSGIAAAAEPVYDAEIVEDDAPAASAPGPEPAAPAQPARPATATGNRHAKVAELLARFPFAEPADVAALVARVTGSNGDVTSLSSAQCSQVTSFLHDALAAADGDPEQALSSIWQQFTGAAQATAGDHA
jgi:recombination protein RecT